MAPAPLRALRVTHDPGGGHWPEGGDCDFTAVNHRRGTFKHTRLDGRSAEYEYQIYDPFSAYSSEARAAAKKQPIGVQLLRQPSAEDERMGSEVLIKMFADLRERAEECSVIFWDSAIQCHPSIAKWLKKLFRLAVLSYCDDMPGYSETHTFPVARYFDVLAHGLYIRNFETGQRVRAAYAEQELFDCRFFSVGTTLEFDDVLFEQKLAAQRSGSLPFDVAWLGTDGLMQHRRDRLKSIQAAAPDRTRSRFYGHGMRDGRYLAPASNIYAHAALGLNVAESSFFNYRFGDLCTTGTVQVMYDKNGELPLFGFVPGENYIGYDGTAEDFWRQVKHYRSDGVRLAKMAAAARTQWKSFSTRYGDAEVQAGILLDYEEQIRDGRS